MTFPEANLLGLRLPSPRMEILRRLPRMTNTVVHIDSMAYVKGNRCMSMGSLTLQLPNQVQGTSQFEAHDDRLVPMNNYHPIADVLDRLKGDYDWTHSFIRECYFTSSHVMTEYADGSGTRLTGDIPGPLHARLVVAIAGNELNTGIEFLFGKIAAFSIQTFDELSFEYDYDRRAGHLVYFASGQSTDDCYMRAESVLVRFLGRSYLGPRQLLGFVFPTSKAVPATKVEGCWRQCGNCSNIWEENPKVEFSRCPDCGEVTRLIP